jgi:glycosyltransferase involved in cell wall biosynthesis
VTQILIDGRRAQGQRTGVGNYIAELLKAWPQSNSIVLTSRRLPPLEGALNRETLPGGLRWHWAAWRIAAKRDAVYFSPESMLVPILIGRRALLTVHDLTPLENTRSQTFRNVLIHRLALRLALRRVGCVVVPTARVKRDLAVRYPRLRGRVVVVAEGVRTLREPAASQESDDFAVPSAPYALYVGTIEPRKNVLTLIRAFLDATSGDWTLVLAGKLGWLDDKAALEFIELTTNPRVHWLGFVSDALLDELYKNADLFCYVSESEGFGLPVAEAMSYGLPVLHSDDPALVEVAGTAGIEVRRENLADDLRRKLETATNLDADGRKQYRERAIQASARFQWPEASKNTLELLAGLDG